MGEFNFIYEEGSRRATGKWGNYGTAHIYRSSMSAVVAFNESGNLPFRKVTPEFLKGVLKRICVEEIVAGIRFLLICVR